MPIEVLVLYIYFSLGVGARNAWAAMSDEYSWQPYHIGWRECFAFVAIWLVSAVAWPVGIYFDWKDR